MTHDLTLPWTHAPVCAFGRSLTDRQIVIRRWLKPKVCPFRSCEGRRWRLRGAWESIFPAQKPLTTKTFHHIKDVGALRFTFNYMSVSREPKHPHYGLHELNFFFSPYLHSYLNQCSSLSLLVNMSAYLFYFYFFVAAFIALRCVQDTF